MLTSKQLIQVIFLCLFIVFISRINTPFIRKDDANSVRYALFAKNIIRLPVSQHKMANINSLSSNGLPETSLAKPTFYLDHPPGIVWLSALISRILGDHYYSYRLLPIASSLASIYFLYKIFQLLNYSQPITVIFLSIFAFNPLFVEHGEVLNFEPTTFFLLTASFYYLLKFKKTKTINSFIISMIIWAVALLTDWPAYFALIPYLLFLPRKQFKKLTSVMVLIPVAVFGLNMAWYSQINKLFVIHFLTDQILFKNRPSIDLIGFIKHQISFAIMNFTHLIPISLLGIILMARGLRKRFKKYYSFLTFYLAIGVLNILLFLSWADTHRFWTYYLLPAVILPAAVFVEFLIHKFKNVFPKYLFLFTALLFYIYLSFYQIKNRQASQAISITELKNINKINQLLSPETKIFADKNIYKTHDGLLLRYHLDKQLTIYQDDQIDEALYFIKPKKESCPVNKLDISKSYQLCL